MKCGFSVKVSGEGGMAVVVPRARSGFGGCVGSRVRMCVFAGPRGLGKIYWVREYRLWCEHW